jgi:hypothetical protein
MYSIIFNIQLGVLDTFKRTIQETHLYLAALFDFLKLEKKNKYFLKNQFLQSAFWQKVRHSP